MTLNEVTLKGVVRPKARLAYLEREGATGFSLGSNEVRPGRAKEVPIAL